MRNQQERDRDREYYLKNRERILARVAEYQQSNKERINEWHRQRYRGTTPPKRIRIVHGDKRRSGVTGHYNRWLNMRRRCLDPRNVAFPNYGGRGISIHPDWITDYAAFRDWVNANLGPCPEGQSLDRIDNNGDYAPGNLRWADRSTQNYNQRRAA